MHEVKVMESTGECMMTQEHPKFLRVEDAYNYCYQTQVRSGCKSMSDLDIGIEEMMNELGYERVDHPYGGYTWE